jgi:hypothetical protein
MGELVKANSTPKPHLTLTIIINKYNMTQKQIRLFYVLLGIIIGGLVVGIAQQVFFINPLLDLVI